MSLVRLALATAVTVLAFAGCNDDDPPEGEPTTPAASSTTAQSSTPPTTSSTPTDDTSTTPAVTPASGPLLDLDTFTVNLPAGWARQVPGGATANGFDPGRTGGQINAFDSPGLGVATLDYEVEFALQDARDQGLDPVREPNREIAGVEAFVVSGHNKLTPTYYEFGMVYDDRVASILITFGQKVPEAQDIIESVLASVTLK